MDEFIQSISKRLDISEAKVRDAVAVMIQFFRENGKGTEIEALIDQIPGARMLAETDVRVPEGGSGLFGGLLARAGGLLGPQTGAIAEVAGRLESVGIDLRKAIPFVQTFVDEARSEFGPGVVAEFLDKVPALRTILDPDKKPPAA